MGSFAQVRHMYLIHFAFPAFVNRFFSFWKKAQQTTQHSPKEINPPWLNLARFHPTNFYTVNLCILENIQLRGLTCKSVCFRPFKHRLGHLSTGFEFSGGVVEFLLLRSFSWNIGLLRKTNSPNKGNNLNTKVRLKLDNLTIYTSSIKWILLPIPFNRASCFTPYRSAIEAHSASLNPPQFILKSVKRNQLRAHFSGICV